MTLYSDFLTITIDGIDVSAYVLKYQRNDSLCDPGQTFSLMMTRKKPDDTMLSVGMSKPVVITEKYPSGTVVLKGYTTNVEIDAKSAEMRVSGMDKYVLLQDYFIDTELYTEGQTVAWWISYLCDLVGLSVQFDYTPTNATDGDDGNQGTAMGHQTATDRD